MSQDPGQKYSNLGFDFTPTQHHDTYPAIDPAKIDLNGKFVLITGASRGIGKAAAISFARAGASGIALGARSPLDNVVLSVKNAAKEAGRPAPMILALKLDVADRQSVEASAKQVNEAFDGRLDILINNAGYLSTWVPLGETNPDEWWKDWEVNIKGVYLMTHAFLPLLLNSTLRTVVNVSSIGAHLLTPGASAYQITKLAIIRFSEFLMTDYGNQGLLSYSIHPGGVKSDLSLSMPEYLHDFLNDEPALSGDTLVWLTKERRVWLAGRYVSVSWDVEELEKRKEEVLKGDLLKLRMAVNAFPAS